MRHRALAVLCAPLLGGWVSDAAPLPPGLDPGSIDEDCAVGDGELARPGDAAPCTEAARAGEPPPVCGRAIAVLERAACEASLRGADVAFTPVASEEAPGVAQPIRLGGPLRGIRIVPEHGEHAVIDCRLAVALLAWAPALRALGVAGLEHLSIYRAGARVRGTQRVSGHARALAIDASALVLQDGTRITVLEDWMDRARGVDPCARRDGEPARNALLREAVCAAVQQDLFQVVITPHHDEAHASHVHLELRPGVPWTWVR